MQFLAKYAVKNQYDDSFIQRFVINRKDVPRGDDDDIRAYYFERILAHIDFSLNIQPQLEYEFIEWVRRADKLPANTNGTEVSPVV